MYEAVKIALDPTPRQEEKLWQHAGASRFAFNACLEHVKEEWDKGNTVNTSQAGLRRWFNSAKEEIAPWWRECSKEAFSHGTECLSKAIGNYFDSRSGKRKGPETGFPERKKRNKSRKSFAYTTGSFGVKEGDPYRLKLPKIGEIHTFENVARRMKDVTKVTRMTVSLEGGRWYASLCVERPFFKRGQEGNGAVGIDLGVKTAMTCSDGTVYENEKPMKRSARKIRKLNKKLARQKKGSKRRSETILKLQKAYGRIACQRRDFQQKATTELVKKYDTICLEDLNVSGMSKNHRLAGAVLDVGFYEIRRQIEYKAMKYGKTVSVIGRFYPSSKLCSACGSVKSNLKLSDRTYVCGHCGLEIDRDLNAAINIKAAGSAPEALNGRGESARPEKSSNSVISEAASVKRQSGSAAVPVKPEAAAGNGGMQAAVNIL